jgi:nucleoside-diphosphate-sugar epimerase
MHGLRPGQFEEVLLLDNLATQRYCSLFNLPAGVKFRFVEDDVCKARLESYFEGAHAVVHMAAITNAAGSFENQEQVERVNYQGTERVARACVACGSRLLFLSTTSVYGTQEAVVAEDCRPDELKPQSPYAESKLRAEQFLENFGRTEGLKFIACRFGTIFGTSIGMRFHTAINKFCWQACLGQPITVWRTALNQKRPYLDLGDGVAALSHILRQDIFDNQVYNVLTANSTVDEIVQLIRTQISDLRVEYVESKIMNQLSYTVAAEKFKATGFQAQGSLARGIQETIALLSGIAPGRLLGPRPSSDRPI